MTALPGEATSPVLSGSGTRPGRLEIAILFVVLILFSEGVLPRLFASEETADGSAVLRLLWLPVYAVTFAGLIWKFKAVTKTMLRMPFLMVLIILSALSFLWSIDPGLSQRRGFAVAMTCAAGIFIGSHYDWKTLLRVLGAVWITVSVLNFLTGLLNPGFGVMSELHIGSWQGLYYEKNQLGGHMARAALVCAFLILMDRPWRVLWAASLLLCTVLVLLSTSKTSLLGLLLAIAVLGIGAWMKRGVVAGIMTAWAGMALGGALLTVLVLDPGIVFAALGRDPSLTGRTDIWSALIGVIADRPLLGYGYGAFWGVDSEPAFWVREVLEWDAPTAHNGWLEIALALGLTGLVFLVLDFLLTVWRAVLASIDTWAGVFALGVCAQLLLFSLSESLSLQQNALTWVTYVAVAAKLANRPRNFTRRRPVLPRRPVRYLPMDAK